MSRVYTVGKGLVFLGLLLVAAGFVGVGPGGPEAASVLVLGLLLLGITRFDISFSGIKRQLAIDRQDIVASTDWSRIGKYTLRSSFGIALAVSGVLLLVVSLAVQEYTQAALWAQVGILGVIIHAISWRFAHEITADYTQTISVQTPDLFSVHSFHIALRQRAEDLGYRVLTSTSPAESGSRSPIADEILHSKGGFKARRRPIEDAKPIANELDDPYADRILTVTTVGVFSLLLGILLFSIGGEIAGDLPLLGIPLAVIGIAVIAYDYITRTREWGELYCVEEGTVSAVTINEYEDDIVDGMDYGVDPSISSPATGAVLSVTVGAKCTSLYDESKLEADFEALVDTIETAATEFQSNALGEVDGPTVLTHTEPAFADDESQDEREPVDSQAAGDDE